MTACDPKQPVRFFALSLACMKKFAFGTSVVILGVAVAITVMRLGRFTTYCPLPHWLNETAICVTLDEQGDKVLIQHGELDTNVYYFEVIDDGASSFYEFPFDLVAQIGPGDYTAVFDPADDSKLIVEGQSFDLVPVQPKW